MVKRTPLHGWGGLVAIGDTHKRLAAQPSPLAGMNNDDEPPSIDRAGDSRRSLDSGVVRIATVAVVAVAVLGVAEAAFTGQVSGESYAALGATIAALGLSCVPRPRGS